MDISTIENQKFLKSDSLTVPRKLCDIGWPHFKKIQFIETQNYKNGIRKYIFTGVFYRVHSYKTPESIKTDHAKMFNFHSPNQDHKY